MNYISSNTGEGSSVKSDRNLAEDASEYANQSRSSNHDNIAKPYPRSEEEKKLTPDQKRVFEEKAKEMHSSSSIYDEEVRAYNKTDPRQDDDFVREDYQFDFYVDNYTDDKIKEIISIFRNDFKPPKNLWIENMNVQQNPDVNYFNDVFADDDNYNESEEHVIDGSQHNQEIDDIGQNISEIVAAKSPQKQIKPIEEVKIKDPKVKDKDNKPDAHDSPTDSKYSDRIKPSDDVPEGKVEENKGGSNDLPAKIPKEKKPSTKPDNKKEDKELKVTRAKDGLNIEVNDSGISDMGRNSNKQNKPSSSGKSSKRASKTAKVDPKPKIDDFNKTHKLPHNILQEYDIANLEEDDSCLNPSDNYGPDDTTRNKLSKEAEEQINRQLRMIEEEKAKNDYEKHNKRRKDEKKSSRSKSKQYAGQKSSRDGSHPHKKNKRQSSHNKRGSSSNMHELKKKMGWTNSHTSRGRTAGEKFLNYSLDEINQKLHRNFNTNTSTNQKGVKKRLNKSFENVFSACASTSRAKHGNKRSKKMKKKPISSSPRRVSIKEKKNSSSHAKTPNTTSRKRLAGSLYNNKTSVGHNIKDLGDSCCLVNFSSMPSTPTGNAFIKKLGEKMNIIKAEKEKFLYNLCKNQLSLTSPNMNAFLKAIKPNEKKVKNLKLKTNDASFLSSSGVLSSRNGMEDRIVNSSRQNEQFSFGSSNEAKLKRPHKYKNKEPMTERLKA